MATDRLVVNAGGRCFETTATTLRSSGSEYFAALLGPTGAALGSLSSSDNTIENGTSPEVNSETSQGGVASVTPHSSRRKRARSDNDDRDESTRPEEPRAIKQVFMDRDPDLFADILHFMRSARLPARTRQDMARLEDLKAEALFFAYSELERVCNEALQELQTAMEDALKPEPQPAAKCLGLIVKAGECISVPVPEHKILYIASATLAGRVRSYRYRPREEEKEKRRKEEEEDGVENTCAYGGCYIGTNQKSGDGGDFQLEAYVGGATNDWFSIAHVAIDHFHLDFEMGMNLDLRQDLRHCLASHGSNNRHVRLRSLGSGDWHLSCWIGDACAIPQVSSDMHRSKESRNRRLARARNAITTAGAAATSAVTTTAAETAASTTSLTMMVAMIAMMVANR